MRDRGDGRRAAAPPGAGSSARTRRGSAGFGLRGGRERGLVRRRRRRHGGEPPDQRLPPCPPGPGRRCEAPGSGPRRQRRPQACRRLGRSCWSVCRERRLFSPHPASGSTRAPSQPEFAVHALRRPNRLQVRGRRSIALPRYRCAGPAIHTPVCPALLRLVLSDRFDCRDALAGRRRRRGIQSPRLGEIRQRRAVRANARAPARRRRHRPAERGRQLERRRPPVSGHPGVQVGESPSFGTSYVQGACACAATGGFGSRSLSRCLRG